MDYQEPDRDYTATNMRPYIEVGRFLWEQLNELTQKDHEKLLEYNIIIKELIPLFDEYLPPAICEN